MDTVLELESIRKTYRPGLFRKPVDALAGLDLAVPRGRIYGFLGANGAGKTTTFKIVLGLLRPTAGRGRLLGHPLGDREGRRRLGYLPELPSYYPHLTPRELLRFARALSEVAADEAADLELLASLGLDAEVDRPLKKLSKGQVQRLGLAQALVHRPEFLLLDEPMSGLDPLGRGLVRDRLLAERARGCTILMASHLLADVEVLADFVGVVVSGRLVLEGNPAQLLASAVDEVVIRARGQRPASLLSGLPAGARIESEAVSEEWQVRLPRPAPLHVDAALRRLLSAGAQIEGVETRRASLERLVVDLLKQAPAREPDANSTPSGGPMALVRGSGPTPGRDPQ